MFPLLELDFYRIPRKLVFLVLLILIFGVSQLGEIQDESQITDVQKVSSCPATREKWLEDAKGKNCSGKNVTFRYHCLLNHWRNQSFVLCGAAKGIHGFFCPEYDERRGRIQANYDYKCITFIPPCPIKYNSSEVFKYPECIKPNVYDKPTAITETIVESNISLIHIFWAYAVILIILFIISITMGFLFYLRRKIHCNLEDIGQEITSIDEGDLNIGQEITSIDEGDLNLVEFRPTMGHRPLFDHDVYMPSLRESSRFFDDLHQTRMGYPRNDDGVIFYSDRYSLRDYKQRKTSITKPVDFTFLDHDHSLFSNTGHRSPFAKEVEFSKPIEDIEKLTSLIHKEFHQQTSDASFAKTLLHCIDLDDILHELKSLSRKVILNGTTDARADNYEHGKVYFADVMVTCEKNQLNVKQKDSNAWGRFLQTNQKDPVRVILIHSKSVRVIEAKIKVYREYKSVIDSCNIFLQHEHDDFEEIAKLSVHNKLSRLCGAIEVFTDNLDNLDMIIEIATGMVLSKEHILERYIGTSDARDQFNPNKNQSFIQRTLEIIANDLALTICNETLEHVKLSIEDRKSLELKGNICNILTTILKSKFSRPNTEIENLNFYEMLEEVTGDISHRKEEILGAILSVINATYGDLRNLQRALITAKRDLKLKDQNEAVKAWEKREELICLQGLKKYSSVLKYIAGWKNNKPTVKVFLRYEDTDAMNFFKHNNQIPRGTCLEFVNVAEKSKEIFRAEIENTECSSFPDENQSLCDIINQNGEKIYAKHSSIVGLDVGNISFEGKMQPCIIIYSLDKDLIPYGENPLPTSLEGWHCDVREDIVMFGMCFDCRQITHPNPGCCIGLPSNGIGSAGFLVKTKRSDSAVTGFLTAAHVAARNWTDLYDFNELFSNLVTSDCRDEIVHPFLPGCTDYRIIGKVKESFCGNWGEERVGMDAAFVQNSEPRQGELSELQLADEKILKFYQSKVMKRGGSTGETEGLLTGNSLSVCVDKDFNSGGGFYYFAKCFSIQSINRPFFERGDSGSGVFLMENGKPTKPLGIAFANLLLRHKTAVCRIDKIVEVFGLSVYQNEEPMDI